MKRWSALLVTVLWCFCAGAQERSTVFDDLEDYAWDWAEENLDENLLAVLKGDDRAKVQKFLAELEKDFAVADVTELGQLKEAAKALVPLLEQNEETQPYAVWLKTRIDYLEVAEQLLSRKASPSPRPGESVKPLPPPSAQVEREIWVKKLVDRPWPEKAKRYVAPLKQIFLAQNVPPALVWVAEVESSFDPRARSPRGARGLFQLRPATARSYGLRTVWLFDQRVDPEESGRAAAQHLRYLYGLFKDWRLALAAYNAGEGVVRNALTRHRARTYDEIARDLPAETQLYVPKVEAILLRREGIKLGRLQAPRPTVAK
jgi:membrane-bound lytic murein transglycosylase D